jgi:hypothetical protein
MNCKLRSIIVAAIAIILSPCAATAYSSAQQTSIYAVILAQFAGANCPLSVVVGKETYAELAEAGLKPEASLNQEFKNASLIALADVTRKFERGQDALCAYAWKQFGPGGDYKRQMLEAKYAGGTGPVALELLETKLIQTAYFTEISMQFLSKRFLGRQTMFMRLRCEIFDTGDNSLGVFSKDYSSGNRRQSAMIVPRTYWRPTLRVGRIDAADHASCRFATNEDPLPTVSLDEIEVELPTTNSVQTTNRSPFHVGNVAFTCVGPDEAGRGGKLSTEYNNRQSLGIAPGETMNPQYVKNFAERCFVTAVKVEPAPDMRPDMNPNKPHL